MSKYKTLAYTFVNIFLDSLQNIFAMHSVKDNYNYNVYKLINLLSIACGIAVYVLGSDKYRPDGPGTYIVYVRN